MGTIYLIINKQNGHKYIGQTTLGMNKVWQFHIECAKRMHKANLYCAMRKYGNHLFSIKQIDECNENELDDKQSYWIGRYNPEYNDSNTIVEEVKEEVIIKKEKKLVGFQDPKNRGTGVPCRIQVFGINIETGEERTWESARSAAEEVAGNPNYGHNILNAADKGWKAYGYRWRRIGGKTNKRKIYGIHKKTWERSPIYNSIREVIRINGGHTTGLSKSLKNPHKYTWRGYYWFYEN